MERYAEVSQAIRPIFESYTPLVEPISLDEAFLDVTDSEKLFGPAEQIGRAIKSRIREQTHLTASVGIAPNKFLAKLASDLRKPDGFVVITEQNKQEILDPLPVGKIWGVGKVTEKALHSYGIETIGQLRGRTPAELKSIVGNAAEELLQLAHGEDDREVEPDRQCKSLSSEQTFATDVSDATILLERPDGTGRGGGRAPAPARAQGPDDHAEAALRRLPHGDAQRDAAREHEPDEARCGRPPSGSFASGRAAPAGRCDCWASAPPAWRTNGPASNCSSPTTSRRSSRSSIRSWTRSATATANEPSTGARQRRRIPARTGLTLFLPLLLS